MDNGLFLGQTTTQVSTALSTNLTLVSASNTDHTFTNTTAYRYYKLEKTGTGSTASNPYTYEIQFFNTADTDGKATEVGKFKDVSTTGHTITPTGSYHSQAHGGIKPAIESYHSLTWPASLKKTGSAGFYFAGSGDYLELPDSADWELGDTFTLETWLNMSSSPTNTGQQAIYAQQASSSSRFVIWVNGTTQLNFS